jgi:hypothetical protein
MINAYIDLFGPDTHNVLFTQLKHIITLIDLTPKTRRFVKQIDPRKRLVQVPDTMPWSRHIAAAVDLDHREIRARMMEMHDNLRRFIEYKMASYEKQGH